MNLFELLDSLGVKYIRHQHPAVFTVAEADKYYENVKGGKSKNLFLCNKNKSKYYLILLESSKRLNLNILREALSETKLSFASPEELKEKLDLAPGSVSPFGLINDTHKEVAVVIDEDLWAYDRLHYHPNINTETLELSRDDFKKFLDHCGNTIKIVKL